MKLTESEQEEKKWLRDIQQSTRPMTEEQFRRLAELNQKEFLNSCTNPHCIGYTGEDSELRCKKCGGKLYKLSTHKDK